MNDPRWAVQLSPGAARAIERLPHKVAAAVVEFVTGTLPTDPRRLSKPLRGELEGLYGPRRGDYRVLFEFREVDSVLLIVRIDHRAHVFRSQ